MKSYNRIYNKKIYLSDEEYTIVLANIGKLIKETYIYKVEDDTTPGAKSTTSNCGMCSKAVVDRVELAMFPDDYLRSGRRDLKYPRDYHACPFDSRPKNNSRLNGCYYSCMLRGEMSRHRATQVFYNTLRWWKAKYRRMYNKEV